MTKDGAKERALGMNYGLPHDLQSLITQINLTAAGVAYRIAMIKISKNPEDLLDCAADDLTTLRSLVSSMQHEFDSEVTKIVRQNMNKSEESKND